MVVSKEVMPNTYYSGKLFDCCYMIFQFLGKSSIFFSPNNYIAAEAHSLNVDLMYSHSLLAATCFFPSKI
jgi:hypothetical protein